MPPATGESNVTVGTGNLIVKIAVALAVFPLASVATATSVNSPSSNGSAGLYVKGVYVYVLLPTSADVLSPLSASTGSPSRVRLSVTGVATPDKSPWKTGLLISYICPASGT